MLRGIDGAPTPRDRLHAAGEVLRPRMTDEVHHRSAVSREAGALGRCQHESPLRTVAGRPAIDVDPAARIPEAAVEVDRRADPAVAEREAVWTRAGSVGRAGAEFDEPGLTSVGRLEAVGRGSHGHHLRGFSDELDGHVQPIPGEQRIGAWSSGAGRRTDDRVRHRRVTRQGIDGHIREQPTLIEPHPEAADGGSLPSRQLTRGDNEEDDECKTGRQQAPPIAPMAPIQKLGREGSGGRHQGIVGRCARNRMGPVSRAQTCLAVAADRRMVSRRSCAWLCAPCPCDAQPTCRARSSRRSYRSSAW